MAAKSAKVKVGTELEIKKGHETVAVISYKGDSAPKTSAKSIAAIMALHSADRCFVQHNYIRHGSMSRSFPFTLTEYRLSGSKAVKVNAISRTPI